MKPTQPLQKAIKRLALNTKQASKGFYKGTGTGSMGWHTKHGGYQIDWAKLTPFVVRRIQPRVEDWSHTETKSSMDGKEYLQRWKEEGGNI